MTTLISGRMGECLIVQDVKMAAIEWGVGGVVIGGIVCISIRGVCAELDERQMLYSDPTRWYERRGWVGLQPWPVTSCTMVDAR